MSEIYIAPIITILVIVVLFIILPIFYNKTNNLNFDRLFTSINNIIDSLGTIVNNLGIPTEIKQTIDMIMEYSTKAVEYAEQLYKSGQLDKDKRKEKAVEYVNEILSLSNIIVTDEINKIIVATIEAAVLLLPKTHTNENN